MPMTILSWLVIFTYGIIDSGNVWYGLIALLGLCFAHLGTNLIDDYFDYKSLIKQVDFDKSEYLKHSQKTKCRYLISGAMKESQLFGLAVSYFTVALFCGLFLFLKCGMGVLIFALIGAFIAVLYPFISRFLPLISMVHSASLGFFGVFSFGIKNSTFPISSTPKSLRFRVFMTPMTLCLR